MRKYILWDHDGVLVETEPWYFKASQRALAEIGVELTSDVYQGIMVDGRSCWELAEKAGISVEVINSQRKIRNSYYQTYLATEDIEIPGVEAVLKSLSKDYRMAIVTTSRRVDFELIHNNRSIVQYMDFVLTVEDYAKAKPDPEPYLCALRKFDASGDEAVVVEDSARGLKSAVAAGVDCAMVFNKFTKMQDFSTATYAIKSLSELADVIAAK